MEGIAAGADRRTWTAEWVHNALQYCVCSAPHGAQTAVFLVSDAPASDVLIALIVASLMQRRPCQRVAVVVQYCHSQCDPRWLQRPEHEGSECVTYERVGSTATALQILAGYSHRVIVELGHCLQGKHEAADTALCFDHIHLCSCTEQHDQDSTATSHGVTMSVLCCSSPLTDERLLCTRIATGMPAATAGFAAAIAACDQVFSAEVSQLFPDAVPVPNSMRHAKLVFDYSQAPDASDEPKIDEDNQIVRFPVKGSEEAAKTDEDSRSERPVADPSKMQVWTTAGPGASIDYLMAVLRLSAQDPWTFLQLAPILRQKMAYIIESGDARRAELVPLLLTVAGKTAAFAACLHLDDVDAKTIVRIVSELCRILAALSEAAAAKRVNAHFLDVLPDQPELWAIQGRLALAEHDAETARAAFAQLLALRPNDAEAAMMLQKLDRESSQASNAEAAAAAAAPQPENDVSPRTTGAWAKLAYLASKKAHQDEGHVLLESNVKLSESLIWATQRRFYDSKGLDAWGNGDEHRVDAVPFYVTSNLRIARAYATLIYQYYVDLFKAGALDPAEGVFVVETGAGHGKFSYLLVQALRELWQKTSELQHIQCTLVVTDFTERNLDGIAFRPEFAELIEQRWVDFAVLDLTAESMELHLRHARKTISPSQPTNNPLSVIMNYVLDTLPADVFKVGDDRSILEGRVTTYSTQAEEPDPTAPTIVTRLRRVWQYVKPESDRWYDDDETVNQTIAEYAQTLKPGSVFTMPIAGIRAMRRMQTWVHGGRLAVLIADKSYNRLELVQQHSGHPTLAVHGSISITVNLHAVGRALELTAGAGTNAVMHSEESCAVIDVCMACVQTPGGAAKALPAVFYQLVSAVALTDIFILRDHIEDVLRARHAAAQRAGSPSSRHSISLEAVQVMFKLSGWDVDVLQQFCDAIVAQVPNATERTTDALRKTLPNAERGYIPFFDPKRAAEAAYDRVRAALDQAGQPAAR